MGNSENANFRDSNHNRNQKTWKILSVEDDPTYQASLIFSLSNLPGITGKLQVISASSVAEAETLANQHQDLAIIFLDVVMEEEDSGLRFVNMVRTVLNNYSVRIVLLTGQPGVAPCDDVMSEFDVDDYWCKSELTPDHLATIVKGNLRTWSHMRELQQTNQGLLSVVTASREIAGRRDLVSFSQSVLDEIAKIIVRDQGGVACILYDQLQESARTARIMAATGCFQDYRGRQLQSLNNAQAQDLFERAFRQKQHLFTGQYSVLCFPGATSPDASLCLTLIKSEATLEQVHINLLKVFGENVTTEFKNLLLANRLTELAFQDQELGVFNRNWMLRRLRNMTESERSQTTLVLIAVDNFAEMGAAFGENHCNEVLSRTHDKLSSVPGFCHAIARLASDELAILIDRHSDLEAESVNRLCLQEVSLAEGSHLLSYTAVSIPLTQVIDYSPVQLLRMAESMVDLARQKKVSVLEYSRSINDAMACRYATLNRLRIALQENQIYIALQPKFEIQGRRITGFEALARWRDNDGKAIPPIEFIPLAETAGLMPKLGLYIAEKVMAAAAQLQAAGIELPIAFNVSCSQLLHRESVAQLLQVIEASGQGFSRFEIEITESEFISDYARVQASLRLFLERGIGVSIDDFGTGYSSLAHITHLPATTLKIDRIFIQQMGLNQDGEDMVDIILRLGQRFNYNLIAEGIETEEQLQRLRHKGCGSGQGFLFARPMPVAELIDWISSRKSTD